MTASPDGEDMPLPTLVLFISGSALWVLFYVLTIRRGYLDRRCGAPMMAICLGMSWEFLFGFVEPQLPVMALWNRIGWSCDLVLLCQFLRYNRGEFPANLPSSSFIPTVLIALLFSFLLVVCFTYQFGDFTGRISGFLINLPMSVWYVTMLIGRNGIEGQSLYAAAAKMLGTLCFDVISFQHDPRSKLLGYLYVSILFFDILYIVLLARKYRELGVSFWKRI